MIDRTSENFELAAFKFYVLKAHVLGITWHAEFHQALVNVLGVSCRKEKARLLSVALLLHLVDAQLASMLGST